MPIVHLSIMMVQLPSQVIELEQVNFLIIIIFTLLSFPFFVYWLHDEQIVFLVVLPPLFEYFNSYEYPLKILNLNYLLIQKGFKFKIEINSAI